jgi:hypothetical protein
MTKFGETNHFQACDFIALPWRVSPDVPLCGAIVNNRRPDDRLLALYRKQKSDFVDIGLETPDCPLVAEDLLETSGDVIRHDPQKLADLIARIIFE